MLVILIGHSGSGKSSVVKELVNTFKMNRVFIATTRPKRKDDDEEGYVFINNDTFNSWKEMGLFTSTSSYRVGDETWKYGTVFAKDTITEDDYVVALGAADVADLISNNPDILENTRIFMLDCPVSLLMDRCFTRGDEERQVSMRYLTDQLRFKLLEMTDLDITHITSQLLMDIYDVEVYPSDLAIQIMAQLNS